MGHWSVEDFVKEVQDVNQYSQERPQAVMLASSLVSGLVEKIKLTNMWTCGKLLEVTKAVKSTQLEDQHKNNLLKALDDKTMDQQKKAVKLTMVPQSLTQIHNYLSASEWMNAQQSSMAALQAISTRLRLCGVKALKEDTKKWCTALMVHFEVERAAGEMPAYTTIYRMSQEMATAFQCSQVEAKAEPLVQYPVSPLELGEAWLNQVYDPKDMPTNRDVPNLWILVKDHIPIRNTSALLTKEKNQVVPSSGSNEPNIDKMMGFFQQLGSAFLQGHMASALPSPNTGELLLHSFQPKRLPRLDQTSAGAEPAKPALQDAQPALQLALPAPPAEKPKLADPQPPQEDKQEAAPQEKKNRRAKGDSKTCNKQPWQPQWPFPWGLWGQDFPDAASQKSSSQMQATRKSKGHCKSKGCSQEQSQEGPKEAKSQGQVKTHSQRLQFCRWLGLSPMQG